jgi:hypothetical protein
VAVVVDFSCVVTLPAVVVCYLARLPVLFRVLPVAGCVVRFVTVGRYVAL